ncbi:hypothetical protein F0562_000807 [Nyssa sinensis]|uniref:Bet v I/Major latex protein domain-containing protein n=1 Tax=Nyssa sinensis TaxID=561372 RepID=A0A5J5C161_9ASTE|nr:hypothetical protein F0562_000807 [Nyssa sinensis]
MGVTTFTQENTTPVAPGRMFKALILDSHNLFLKLVPQSIKSIEFLQGDGAAGSIKQTNFPKGGEYEYLIHRIDALDVENYMFRFEATGEGCVCKVTSHYHTKGDIELSEEEIKRERIARTKETKGVERKKELSLDLITHPESPQPLNSTPPSILAPSCHSPTRRLLRN